MRSLLRLLTNYRVAVASVFGVLGGGALLYFRGSAQPPWDDFLGGVGSTILSVGVIGLLYETWLRRSIVAEYLAAANLSSDLAETGVRSIREFGSIDWASFFEENRGDVDIAVGYARTWAGQHAGRVLEAAARSGSRVRIGMLDREGPDNLVAFYGETYGTDADGLRQRIDDVINTWTEQAERLRKEGRPVRLVLEGVSRHVPYTFYRAGDQMWVVLTPRQPGRVAHDMPALDCRRTRREGGQGLFEWVMKDIEACRREGHVRTIVEVEP